MDDDPTLSLDGSQRTPADVPPELGAWGDFRLLERVGHGGFGEVYRAWDPRLEREVALKLLLPNSVSGDEEYRALLREARALASVQHTNIVHVYGIDRHDGRVGFWTDFVHGKTLSAVTRAQGPFGYREAALIGLDVARALSAVHRTGLLHRDIKAENVMREEGGRILLMDFGLSSLPQLQANISGSPNYMAPELFQGRAATVSTDIYAMGVLLYFLVTGEYPVKLSKRPFSEAVAAISERRTLIDLRPDLPESFLRTVNVATEIDPAKRFASAGQLAAALAESLGASTPSEVLGSHKGTRKGTKRWVWEAAIAAVVLAIAVGFGVWTGKIQRWIHPASAGVPAGTPANVDDDYLKAQDLLQRGYKASNIDAAEQGFQQVLKEDPTYALAAAGLGNAWFLQYRNGKDPKLLDQARAEEMKALQMDRNMAPPYVTLARMAAMQGQIALARQQVQKAIAIDPNSAEAYGALGEIDLADGRTPDAITAVQRALDLGPNDWRWPVRLGNIYFHSGRLEEAAAEFQKGVELDPENTFAYYDLGLARTQLGQFDEARKNFEKVLSIQPDPDAYTALGSSLELQGRYAEAVAMDQKAIALRPGDYQVWGNLGSAYLWGGQHDKAMQAYRKAIELAEAQRVKSPDDTFLLVQLGDYYASAGQPGSSGVLLRKALVLAPDDPDVAYRAGETYELLGQRAKAISLIAKALAQGYHSVEFQRSPELKSLRADPAFQTALNQAKAEAALDKSRKLQ
ncbi:MAG: tetratricopeptide repeat protein [Acidobacteriaceae bacterium]|jgi:tetratricopeptide (TPR) repeat protein